MKITNNFNVFSRIIFFRFYQDYKIGVRILVKVQVVVTDFFLSRKLPICRISPFAHAFGLVAR